MPDKRVRSHTGPVAVAYGVLAALTAVLAVINPSFFTLTTFTNVVGAALPLALAAMAQTAVVLTKGVDLSIGPTMSLVTAVTATLMKDGAPSIVGISLLGIATGLAVGLVNGTLVVFGRIQPIIATLAVSSVLSGLALFILPQPGGYIPAAFAWLISGVLGPVPTPLVVLGAVLALVWLPVRMSWVGQGLYAVGGNESGAYASGVPVRRVLVAGYALGGLLAGLGGLMLSAQALSGDPTIGAPYTLNSIAAVVIGGTSLAGGRGGMAGSVAGAFILSILVDILFFLGVSAYYQYVLSGAIVVAALAAVTVSERLRQRAWGAKAATF